MVAAAGFALSSSALTPTTIQAGGSAQWTITINPSGGLVPSTVTLSCAVTPLVSEPVGCSVSSVSFSGGVGASTLHVTSTAPHADARLANGGSRPGELFLLALFVPGMCLVGAGIGNQNRRRLLGFGLAILICTGCVLQTACAGAKTSGTTVPGTPQGAYTVTVTGNAGAMQQTTAVVMTVQ